MAEKLIGQNYVPVDQVPKVTGRARYAEDFRADGMLFTKLLLSPMPHARVRGIDMEAALAMPGVMAILTADDLPDLGGAEHALTNEPLYAGEPILAVAAVDELTAAEAVERIEVDLEPLPFVTDPLESLRPDGPSARLDGNALGPPVPGEGSAIETVRWTAEDFAEETFGRLPMGRALEEWSYGDLDAGFADAALVLDETFVVQSTCHHTMGNAQRDGVLAERQAVPPRLHAERRANAGQYREMGWDRSDGRGAESASTRAAGSASKGGGAVSMTIPALLSRKANAPVMMRISREEESYIGRQRTNMTGRARIGFANDGRITALDLYILQDTGPYGPYGDHRSAGRGSVDRVPAAGHALARHQCGDQHAAAIATAFAGGNAGQRHRRAGDHEGRKTARDRSGRDPPAQRACGKGALRPTGQGWTAELPHERVRGRRPWIVVPRSSTGTRGRLVPASGRARKYAASVSPSVPTGRDRPTTTAS